MGIRNGIISSFNSLLLRNDIGGLWGNFVFIERLKKKTYTGIYANNFFWRTYSKSEIDLIEERDGKLFGFEFKWKEKQYTVPKECRDAYPTEAVELINSENFLRLVI